MIGRLQTRYRALTKNRIAQITATIVEEREGGETRVDVRVRRALDHAVLRREQVEPPEVVAPRLREQDQAEQDRQVRPHLRVDFSRSPTACGRISPWRKCPIATITVIPISAPNSQL